MIQSIVVGCGEVGQAIYEVISKRTDVQLGRIDPPLGLSDDREEVDFLHVCLGYTPPWLDVVREYISRIRPAVTIVHSTVPVGTTSRLRGPVAHAPIRGKHPNIAPHLYVYEMYVGAEEPDVGEKVADYLRGAGIPARYAGDTKTTELTKLLCTTQYAIAIAVAQELRRVCEHFGVDYEVAVAQYNRTYNEGIEKVGSPDLRRSIVFPGFIGGHCLMPNLEILRSQYLSPLFEFVTESNELRREEIEAQQTNAPPSESGIRASTGSARPELVEGRNSELVATALRSELPTSNSEPRIPRQ